MLNPHLKKAFLLATGRALPRQIDYEEITHFDSTQARKMLEL
jgi:hypothetical protein